MSFDELIEILLSEEVYNNLKNKEHELFELIPELKLCNGFNQNNNWHIYDVYEHILHVVSGVDNNICLRLAALFHDIGKPMVYKEDENGVGHFYDHWSKSLEIFQKYLGCFNLSQEQLTVISNLIYWHDVKIEDLKDSEKESLINGLGIENLNLLFKLKRADLLSQSPEFHKFLSLINNQEDSMLKIRNI